MNNDLLTLLHNGFLATAAKNTIEQLGDRQSYLGMSDLARGLSCLRTVVAGKMNENQKSHGLGQMLTLQHGHWVEHGIEEALKNDGQKFIPQLEIAIDYEGVPIKAHLDFVLLDDSSICVVELKSTERIRETVYSAHEAQLYGQLGMLHKYWGQKVFRVSSMTTGEFFNFPNLVKHFGGIDLPLKALPSLAGFVLTISRQEAKIFGPYQPNESMLNLLLQTGSKIWRWLERVKKSPPDFAKIPHDKNFSPLCDYCPSNQSCPKFKGPHLPNLEPELENLSNLKNQRHQLEAEINERENQLKALASLMGVSCQWINGQHYRFKVGTQKGRSTFDAGLLKSKLENLPAADASIIENLISASHKIGAPFERFYFSQIN